MPWTNSLAFEVFRSFFQLEPFWPKTRFLIFREMHSFHNLFFFLGAGGVGGVITFITTSGMACREKNTQSPNRSVPHLFGCFRALDHRIALPLLDE